MNLKSGTGFRKLESELIRIDELLKKINGDIFTSRKYKKDLEWWILLQLWKIFKSEKLIFPAFASPIEKNSFPDFALSNDGKSISNYIEITEVLYPGRKRGDEYKSDNSIPDRKISKSEIWKSFEIVLEKKISKKFNLNTWLLIYHNIRYTQITNYGYWHNTVLGKFEEYDFSNCKYQHILVIDAPGEACISLYPYLYVIRPELFDEGTTIVDQYVIRNYDTYKREC